MEPYTPTLIERFAIPGSGVALLMIGILLYRSGKGPGGLLGFLGALIDLVEIFTWLFSSRRGYGLLLILTGAVVS